MDGDPIFHSNPPQLVSYCLYRHSRHLPQPRGGAQCNIGGVSSYENYGPSCTRIEAPGVKAPRRRRDRRQYQVSDTAPPVRLSNRSRQPLQTQQAGCPLSGIVLHGKWELAGRASRRPRGLACLTGSRVAEPGLPTASGDWGYSKLRVAPPPHPWDLPMSQSTPYAMHAICTPN